MHTPILTEATQRRAKCVLASVSLFDYCKIVDSDTFYDEKTAPYLKEICDGIQEFENDDNEALIITMPPRHGKTRTVNNAVNWLLGKNPKYKIMEGAYNVQLSRRSSKIVRDNILERKESNRIVFSDVFPKVTIKDGSGSVDNWGVTGNKEDNYLATAPNAGATGIGCDFLILDDTIKNKYEAYNKEILRKIFEDWFQDTLYSRLEGKRKIIIVMTRWSTGDIAGKLIQMLEEQGRKYRLITKKAFDESRVDKEQIKCNFAKYNINNYIDLIVNKTKIQEEKELELADKIINSAMLNPTILNKKQYDLLTQTIGEDIVAANYNQTPIDLKGKLYKRFLTYNPADIKTMQNPDGKIVFKEIRARADTADQGEDYLAMTIYGVTSDKKAYILDIYYTQDDMETTEKEAARRLLKYNPTVFRPESNNGGRGWSRAVERNYKELGGTKTIFKPYTQTLNKEARILSESTWIQDNMYFPMDWNVRYKDAYNSMNEYQRQGKNEHDDIEDNLTSIAEELDIGSKVYYG